MKAQELFDLHGEVALVTGASSGLGARFAEVLAAHGAKVVLTARRLDRLDVLAAGIGAHAASVALDVSRPDRIAAAFDAAELSFGPVTILINNAGIATTMRFLDTSIEEWERLRATNLDAVWHLSREAAQRMVAAKIPGTIVNIASILSYRVTRGEAAYCVSKAAVEQMTKAMALELARHAIRVNAIAPGYVLTEMTQAYLSSPAGETMKQVIPQRRTGVPADLDGTLLLLASKQASGFMTGTTIVVDGGHLLAFD